MCSGGGNEQLRPLGFPIRKSPDRRLVADSPGLIAGSYVLHRLLVPRHPPCALNNLATTDDARVHYAVLKVRAATSPQTAAHPGTTPHTAGRPGAVRREAGPTRRNTRPARRPVPQDPTACPAPATPGGQRSAPPRSGCTSRPRPMTRTE